MLKHLKHLAAAFVACLVFVLLAQPAEAAGGQQGAFTYELKGNGTAVITKFDWDKHTGGDVYVPRSIDGYLVTEIGPMAFTERDAERLLTDRITSITSFEAPYGSEVAIVLPDTISVIAEKAFLATKISACDIPASVQIIGPGAFACCSNIQRFSVNSRNTTFAVIDGVLFNKIKKELVAYPLGRRSKTIYQIPEGILAVGDYAFFLAEKVVGATTIKYIGDYAFAYCVLQISNNSDPLTRYIVSPHTIGSYAFFHSGVCNCSHVHLDLSNLSEMGEGAFMCFGGRIRNITGFSDSCITSIPPNAFRECNHWPQMPSTVTVIGSYAFAGSASGDGDKNIIIPASVITIEDHAFYKSNFSISFAPNSRLSRIGDQAFMNCWLRGNGEEILTLPPSVRSIGTEAFYDSFTLVVIPESVTEIGENVVNRTKTVLQVTPGSYADIWASENGIPMQVDDTSWLFE